MPNDDPSCGRVWNLQSCSTIACCSTRRPMHPTHAIRACTCVKKHTFAMTDGRRLSLSGGDTGWLSFPGDSSQRAGHLETQCVAQCGHRDQSRVAGHLPCQARRTRRGVQQESPYRTVPREVSDGKSFRIDLGTAGVEESNLVTGVIHTMSVNLPCPEDE